MGVLEVEPELVKVFGHERDPETREKDHER